MAVRGKHHDVVIVGAGIAGAALAAALARAGLGILLLEASESYVDRVRGEAIVPWGLAEAQCLGLLETLLATGGHYVGKLVGYDEVGPPEAAEAGAADLSTFIPGIPGLLTITHPEHCQALFEAAAAAGASVRRGVRVERVETGSAPQVTFQDPDGEQTVSARIIIGADGRPSAMREAFGIGLDLLPPRNLLAGLLVADAPDWDNRVCCLGTEADLCFSVFPMADGRARIYGWSSIERRNRLAGPTATADFLAGFDLGCCPNSRAIAGARAAGPLRTFLNNESHADRPFVDGAVLIGDAAGWTDPLIGCGLSGAYRDARVVSDILLASDDWSCSALEAYAEERRERQRRLRFISGLMTDLFCTFGDFGRDRRRQFVERQASEPDVVAHLIGNLAGPETQPAEVFTAEHRAFVLGEI